MIFIVSFLFVCISDRRETISSPPQYVDDKALVFIYLFYGTHPNMGSMLVSSAFETSSLFAPRILNCKLRPVFRLSQLDCKSIFEILSKRFLNTHF